MLRKNIKLIAVLAILAGLSIYFISKQNSTTLKKELTDFAVKDTASIDKFFLADKSGNKILVERQPNFKWTVNGKYAARPDVVKNFLENISKLQVSSPVTKNAFNNIVKQLATSGIKVEVYSKGNIIKTFYVGGPNQASTGTYMMIENSSTPYSVTIPGFEGYLTPTFDCHELIWRATTIFDYTYKELSSVSFTNFQNQNSSFSISKITDNGISRVSLTIANKVIPNFDTIKVNEYLLQFKNLNYEGIADKVRPTRKDSALHMPIFKLDITAVNGTKKSAMFYKKPVDPGTLDDLGNASDYDVERMFAAINGNTNELFVTQFYVFDKILKPGQSFLR